MSSASVLRRGSFMQRGGFDWEVKLLKGGNIHLINTESGETDRLTVEQWQEDCLSGEIIHIARPGETLDAKTADILKVPLPELPKTMMESVERKMAYVEAFQNPEAFYERHMPDLPTDSRRGTMSLSAPKLRPFLRHVARGLGHAKPPGASTFCKWFKTWSRAELAGHKDARVLASRFDRRGPQARFMSPKVEDMLNTAIDTVWLRLGATKKKAVCQELAKQVKDWNVANPNRPIEMVSERHISRYISEEVDQYVAVSRRRGTDVADRMFKPVGNGPQTSTILEIVEVDHSQAHIAVVDDASGRILGRPWLTVAIDRYSRMLLAVHIHFDGPSLAAVMQALRQAMLPKDFLAKVCPKVSGSYRSIFGVPEAYFFDRGTDFDNDHIREIGLALGIRMDLEAVGCPQQKGIIERFHRTIHDAVDHSAPGARPSLLSDPDRGKNRSEAVLTFSEYVSRVWLWAAGVYANSFHRGIGTTPMARWNEALEKRLPRAPRRRDDLDALLTRVEYCGVSNKGIQWKNLRWNGDALVRIRTRPGFNQKTKVKVRLDEQNLARAWVIDPVTRTPEPLVPLMPEYMDGLSLFQHRLAMLLADEQFEGARDSVTLEECLAMLHDEAESHLQPDAKGKKKVLRGLGRHLGVGVKGAGEGGIQKRGKPRAEPEQEIPLPVEAYAETAPADDKSDVPATEKPAPRRKLVIKEVRKP